MGLFDNGWKGNIVSSLAIGVGVAILGPIVIPVASSMLKPLAKAAIKGGIVLYDKSVEKLEEGKEIIEDLVAEVKSEMEEASSVEAHVGNITAPETKGEHL